jgi:hypothetical protein
MRYICTNKAEEACTCVSNSDPITNIFLVNACNKLLTAKDEKVDPLWLAMITMQSSKSHAPCNEHCQHSHGIVLTVAQRFVDLDPPHEKDVRC